MKNYITLSPFKFWCQKVLPLVYDDSLSYYELLCKVVDYINNIISDMNIMDANILELQTLINNIKTQVGEDIRVMNDKIDNLDIDAAVEKQLDNMAATGELTNLIEPLLEELESRRSDFVKKRGMYNLSYYGTPTKVNNGRFSVYSDGVNYNYDSPLKFKHKSTHTYYISNTGLSTNDGLTPQTPVDNLSRALQKEIVAGDTLVFLDRIVYREALSTNARRAIQESLNIVSGSSDGYSIFTTSSKVELNEVSGPGIYEGRMPSYNIEKVFDCTNENYIFELTECGTLSACQNLPNSYYINSETGYVYVNCDSLDVENIIFSSDDWQCLTVNCTKEIDVYVENIKCVGGSIQSAEVEIKKESGVRRSSIVFNKCDFIGGHLRNGFSSIGVDTYMYMCKAYGSNRDGFNYHGVNLGTDTEPDYVVSQNLEVNCIGAYNGKEDGSENGTTIHDGCSIIRLNGVYYNNAGDNVGDIGTGTSVNVNCFAYNSTGTSYYKGGFGIPSSRGMTMTLINCTALGNEIDIDKRDSKNTINVVNCLYDTINND